MIVAVTKEKDDIHKEVAEAFTYAEEGLIKYIFPTKRADYRQLINLKVTFNCKEVGCDYAIIGEYIGKVDSFVNPKQTIFTDTAWVLIDFQIPKAGHPQITDVS